MTPAPDFCFVSRAENAAACRIEKRDAAREKCKAMLAAEFMDAAKQPLITTVAVPGTTRQRESFLDCLGDDLSTRANYPKLARVVNILMRSEEGKALMQELADSHGEYYCDELVGDEA